jgi:hypothetical protein
MRARRLVPYYQAGCNGDDASGCGWKWQSGDRAEVKWEATRHATDWQHEVVIQNLNDGLVLDGRVRGAA